MGPSRAHKPAGSLMLRLFLVVTVLLASIVFRIGHGEPGSAARFPAASAQRVAAPAVRAPHPSTLQRWGAVGDGQRALTHAAAAVSAASTTLYVSPFGSDTNDCLSAATSCRTIGAALGKAA